MADSQPSPRDPGWSPTAVARRGSGGSTDPFSDMAISKLRREMEKERLRQRRKKQLSRHIFGSAGMAKFLNDATFEPTEVNFVELCRQFHPGKKPTELTCHEQVELINFALRRREGFLIDPHSLFMKYFDLVICAALVFTGIVTPYEVIFMKALYMDDPLFSLNRIVDLIFLVDITLQFFLKVEVSQPGKYGTVILKDRRKLRRRYLRSWFPIDVIGLVPFDIIFLVFNGSDAFSGIKILRCIRLLRLVKLVRILKTSRLILRWQSYFAISFASQRLAKFSVTLLMSSHWMACIWGFTGLLLGATLCDENGARLERDVRVDEVSWVTVLFSNAERSPDTPCDPWHVYMASLHWSVMTITSIGYGDIFPVRNAEYVVCVLCMLAGGVLWAYIIGCLCSIMSNSDPVQINFETSTDLLNRMMTESGVCESKRQSYREYLRESRALDTMNHFREVASRFSPMLKGELLLYTCRSWAKSVFYLEDAPDSILMAIAQEMHVYFYSKSEELHQQSLCLVEQGTLASAGRILTPGSAFNIDCIVAERLWRRFPRTIALTYSLVVALSRAQLLDVSERDPDFGNTLRKAAAKIAVLRCMIMCAERAQQIAKGSGGAARPGLQQTFELIRGEADSEEEQEVDRVMSTRAIIRATMRAMSSRAVDGGGEMCTPVLVGSEDSSESLSSPLMPILRPTSNMRPPAPPTTPAAQTLLKTADTRVALPESRRKGPSDRVKLPPPPGQGHTSRRHRLQAMERRLESSLSLVHEQLQEVRALLMDEDSGDEQRRSAAL